MDTQDSVYGPVLNKTWTGTYAESHHIKLHVHADDGELDKTENCYIQAAGKYRLRCGYFLGEGSAHSSPSPHTQFTPFSTDYAHTAGQGRKGAG